MVILYRWEGTELQVVGEGSPCLRNDAGTVFRFQGSQNCDYALQQQGCVTVPQ